MIESLLQERKHVVAYIDDILITGETEEDHLKNLDEVLKRLGTAWMWLKVEKCCFQQAEVEYCTHRMKFIQQWQGQNQ